MAMRGCRMWMPIPFRPKHSSQKWEEHSETELKYQFYTHFEQIKDKRNTSKIVISLHSILYKLSNTLESRENTTPYYFPFHFITWLYKLPNIRILVKSKDSKSKLSILLWYQISKKTNHKHHNGPMHEFSKLLI